jgi:hypothetical protein
LCFEHEGRNLTFVPLKVGETLPTTIIGHFQFTEAFVLLSGGTLLHLESQLDFQVQKCNAKCNARKSPILGGRERTNRWHVRSAERVFLRPSKSPLAGRDSGCRWESGITAGPSAHEDRIDQSEAFRGDS